MYDNSLSLECVKEDLSRKIIVQKNLLKSMQDTMVILDRLISFNKSIKEQENETSK